MQKLEIPEGYKQCKKCGDIFPKSYFHKHPKTKDKLYTYCKKCSKEYRRNKYVQNKDFINEQNRTWRMTHKEEEKAYNHTPERIKSNHECSANYRLKNKNKTVAQYEARKIPLGEICELCPDDDKRTTNLERHHVDYSYKTIFITCCHECHGEANKWRRRQEAQEAL